MTVGRVSDENSEQTVPSDFCHLQLLQRSALTASTLTGDRKKNKVLLLLFCSNKITGSVYSNLKKKKKKREGLYFLSGYLMHLALQVQSAAAGFLYIFKFQAFFKFKIFVYISFVILTAQKN